MEGRVYEIKKGKPLEDRYLFVFNDLILVMKVSFSLILIWEDLR